MTSAENLFPDLHQKMSKKIAQLTKVIFHLNSKNEEHSDDLTALSDAYETEIDGILKDAYTKVRHPPSPPRPSSASQICALTSQPSQPQTLLPWRQPGGKLMVSLVNSHKNATRIGWRLWEIDLRFAPGLPPGWKAKPLHSKSGEQIQGQARGAQGDRKGAGLLSTP